MLYAPHVRVSSGAQPVDLTSAISRAAAGAARHAVGDETSNVRGAALLLLSAVLCAAATGSAWLPTRSAAPLFATMFVSSSAQLALRARARASGRPVGTAHALVWAWRDAQAEVALEASLTLARVARCLAPSAAARLAVLALAGLWVIALGGVGARWLDALQPYSPRADGSEAEDALAELWRAAMFAALPLVVGWPAALACVASAQRGAWSCAAACVAALDTASSASWQARLAASCGE